MNQVKNVQVNELTLADLRQLGRQGGVTARLEDGSTVTLRPRFGTVTKKGYIAGVLQDVEMVVEYASIYSQIRTIKRDGILIARREKVGHQTVLKATGKGYRKK